MECIHEPLTTAWFQNLVTRSPCLLVPNHIGGGIFSQYGALPADHAIFTSVLLKNKIIYFSCLPSFFVALKVFLFGFTV